MKKQDMRCGMGNWTEGMRSDLQDTILDLVEIHSVLEDLARPQGSVNGFAILEAEADLDKAIKRLNALAAAERANKPYKKGS